MHRQLTSLVSFSPPEKHEQCIIHNALLTPNILQAGTAKYSETSLISTVGFSLLGFGMHSLIVIATPTIAFPLTTRARIRIIRRLISLISNCRLSMMKINSGSLRTVSWRSTSVNSAASYLYTLKLQIVLATTTRDSVKRSLLAFSDSASVFARTYKRPGCHVLARD